MPNDENSAAAAAAAQQRRRAGVSRALADESGVRPDNVVTCEARRPHMHAPPPSKPRRGRRSRRLRLDKDERIEPGEWKHRAGSRDAGAREGGVPGERERGS